MCSDADGDGWPDPVGPCQADSFDCDRYNPYRHPGAAEVCNRIDDDCDDVVDEDSGAPACALSCAEPAGGCEQVAELAVGGLTACVRTTSGGVFCWGLTDADPELPFAPFLVPVPNASPATQLIGTGCAVASDRVVCWGGVPLPYVLPLEPDAVSFARRVEGLCAVTSAGAVICNPTTVLGGERTTPFTSGVRSITGECELMTNGSVHCAGILSGGFSYDVELVASGATLLAAGDGSVCVVAAGELRCWDQDSLDDPGDGTIITGFGGAVALTLGDGYRCALGAAGNVACWEGTVPEGLPPACQIGAGSGFACILAEDSRVLCWGALRDGVPYADATPTFELQEPPPAMSLEPRDERMMFGMPPLGACDNMDDFVGLGWFGVQEAIDSTAACADVLDPEVCFRARTYVDSISEPCLACLRAYATCEAEVCYPDLVACVGFPPNFYELRSGDSLSEPIPCVFGCEGKKRLAESCTDPSECLSNVCDYPPSRVTYERVCQF